MAVRIGSARSSYGNTAPGDQNYGKEVSTENWYLHSKGWIVLRAKDPAQREKIAVAMERACDNNDIGHSQPTRNSPFCYLRPSVGRHTSGTVYCFEGQCNVLEFHKITSRSKTIGS